MPASTPSQTVGPFFSHALPWPDGPLVCAPGTPDEVRVWVRVYDGQGEPVTDGLLETWQADADGHFAHPADDAGSSFRGFGRSTAGDDGRHEICTVKPGRVSGPSGDLQAPHLDVSLFARGLLQRVVTRMYFADEAAANAEDPVLQSLDESRRETLLARPVEGGYEFDIYLQGPDETVFFAV